MSGSAASLTLAGVRKRLGTTVALHPLDLRVERGERFALLGPNGAGKTTTVRLICGFLEPDAGEIRFDEGTDGAPLPGQPQARSWRSRIGVCPQELVVWEQLTCLEQLVFMAGMYGVEAAPARARALELLAALGLADRARRLAGTLSGGMKRRLNLALALVHDPAIVLLDEPGAGLDPASRVLVRDFVRGLAGRTTVILTSHDMDEVDRVADRVGILHEGRLLVVDTPGGLKRRAGPGDALTVEVEPRDEATGAAALGALQAVTAGLGARVAVERRAHRLTVRCPRAVELVADAVVALRAAGVRLSSLSIRENTLEDAFISLTGRSLGHEGAEAVSQDAA